MPYASFVKYRLAARVAVMRVLETPRLTVNPSLPIGTSQTPLRAWLFDAGICQCLNRGLNMKKSTKAAKNVPVVKAAPVVVAKKEIVKVEAARHAAPATVIQWVTKSNPKRPGCAAHTRAAAFWGKPTVGEMLAAGATRLDLCWSADRGELVLKA